MTNATRRGAGRIGGPFRLRGRAVALLLVSAAGCGVLSLASLRTAGADRGNVVARVNGEAIYDEDIMRDMPSDRLDEDVADLRQLKLTRLISQVEVRQFLSTHKVAVEEKEVDKGIAELRKNPPSLGCPCCRYSNLEEYLKANVSSMRELRVDVRNELGLGKYVQEVWKKTYATPQSRQTLIATQRKRTEKEFTKAWQIFFNTFQQVDSKTDPKKVQAEAQRKAEAAWQRLQKGEAFSEVARQVSEDQMSKPNGGSLGFILKGSYGKEFAATLDHLKPGEVSRPFQSPYGWHIIKWEPIKDDELLDVAQVDFTQIKIDEILTNLEKTAKVVKY
ncbi:MAG TPA: peptidylprolyl isomerase [Chthonomonadaceae bacterium]|nr:peptidylprolyl isomerase [Chthonomonadaceae bacterium]